MRTMHSDTRHFEVVDALALADEVRDADAVVVGTGVAGLTAALGLTPRRVTLLSKTRFAGGGSSPWAQGGVAVAMAADDSPKLHALDTLAAAAGLADPAAVSVLTWEGPDRVRKLIEIGTAFDRGALGALKFGREAAHRRRRVLHADGDATGAEIVRALAEEVLRHPSIEIVERSMATDLVLEGAMPGSRVVGVLTREGDRTVFHRAPAVVLATGGFGQAFLRTTNPVENTGDGLALAARAGARLADLEFVQFHPTALDVDADPLPLVTEALRGEGAILVDDTGRRFMLEVHPDAELAPRDVVARALFFAHREGRKTFLDATKAVGAAFPERFPTVWKHCQDHGIDPRVEPMPVTPAAHYSMAGVATDLHGRTSLDGLWACGEVTSTGVHGANRLASNSLLEALVFGERVAKDLSARAESVAPGGAAKVRRETGLPTGPEPRATIRDLMWDRAGLVRSADGLRTAAADLDALRDEAGTGAAAPSEVANLWTVARMVVAAARVRNESRGGHYRSDVPDTDPALAYRRTWLYRPGRPDGSILESVLDAPGLDAARADDVRLSRTREAVMA